MTPCSKIGPKFALTLALVALPVGANAGQGNFVDYLTTPDVSNCDEGMCGLPSSVRSRMSAIEDGGTLATEGLGVVGGLLGTDQKKKAGPDGAVARAHVTARAQARANVNDTPSPGDDE